MVDELLSAIVVPRSPGEAALEHVDGVSSLQSPGFNWTFEGTAEKLNVKAPSPAASPGKPDASRRSETLPQKVVGSGLMPASTKVNVLPAPICENVAGVPVLQPKLRIAAPAAQYLHVSVLNLLLCYVRCLCML